MKRYIKSTQSIFAGYSCNGWFNILKQQRIPSGWRDRQEGWAWDYPESHPDFVENGYEAVKTYTGDSAYSDINNYLRGKPYNKNRWYTTSPEETADRIHSVISKANLPKDIVTIRWADENNLDAYLGEGAADDIKNGDEELYIGAIVKELGFYSSSMSTSAPQAAYESRNVQFITLLPKGTNAIYIPSVASQYGEEDEVLILDKSNFIVRDIQYSENGFNASTGLRSSAKYRVFMEKI